MTAECVRRLVHPALGAVEGPLPLLRTQPARAWEGADRVG